MKRKNMLGNPIVVGSLCVGAGFTIYFNMVSPLLNRGPSAVERTALEEDTVRRESTLTMDSGLNSTVPDDGGIAYRDTFATDGSDRATGMHHIGTSGWKRLTTRNPFVAAPGSPIARDIDSNSFVSPARRSKKNHQSAPVLPNLKAISIGSTDRIALIESQIVRVGDTCRLGIVKQIDPSTVTIASSRGTRILKLDNNKPGVSP